MPGVGGHVALINPTKISQWFFRPHYFLSGLFNYKMKDGDGDVTNLVLDANTFACDYEKFSL